MNSRRGATSWCRRSIAWAVAPDGAFYAWADVSVRHADSWAFCFDMMRRAHVAITPGRDFGHAGTERFARFSYANSMAHLQEAVERLRRYVV